MELTREIRPQMKGGNGEAIIDHILGKEKLGEKCRLFGQITLAPGCSIGYHVHTGEAETFYYIKGEGTFDDNGTKRTVKAGDITWTGNGMGHGVENTGSEDLVFIALIILD